MQRVGKGFSWVETPLFENMLAVRDIAEEAEARVPAQGDDVQEPTAEEVAPHQPPSSPGRMIVDIDQDEGIELELPSDTPDETPKVKDKGKGILIEAPKPMKKKDQIKMDAEY
nr:hypothetical protein [Tanacetum cinerariifolium]